MTEYTITGNSTNRIALRFVPAVEDGSYKDDPFNIELWLQPSGAVLVELRYYGGFMSKYLQHVVRDKNMDERMYGGQCTFSLLPEEIQVLEMFAQKLRNKGDWDAKYAPGASFTGDDITPVDGINDFSHRN